jgi:low temperature requirement protein LtrA
VLALIAIAVGDELAIAHPGDDTTLGFTLLTFGGPALFLLAQASSCAVRSGACHFHGCWAWRRSRSSRWRPHRSR